MFDIGFWELSIIGVIGLLVLGPERLPAVARVVGGYVRKARQTWSSVRAEISAELAAEDFKKAVKEPMDELRDAMRETGKEVNEGLNDLKRSADATINADGSTNDGDAKETSDSGPAEPDAAAETSQETAGASDETAASKTPDTSDDPAAGAAAKP